MPLMNPTEAKALAIGALPETGTMPFGEWIEKCVGLGVERELLRGWPSWKARGEVVTTIQRVDEETRHLIARGG